ncbi:MAG: hypothetical protein HC896_16220 [Bacteroidales bacterium]|nr:hypothetical protein [Bacteroidales bacterium]
MKPTFGENLRFFVRYQVGFMYLRYFMWNFAGRQSDVQAHYREEITKGQWLSGIKPIDEFRLGRQDKLPAKFKDNPGRNKYYMLPLLLGLVGAFFQYKRNRKDFWVVALLFLLTGLAIVVYLNQYPFQPRERDYAYAGSFYAFAIWIGLGVWGLVEAIKKAVPQKLAAPLVTFACLTIPGIMAAENWDDHDRSGRYTARDFAANYLNSCAKNGIIFTNGDNDTFPLWYAQEVEGIRTDVRVVNLSYLGASWYIEQLERDAYDAPRVDLIHTPDKYRQGNRDVIYVIDRLQRPVNLKEAIEFVASDKPETKKLPNYNESIEHLPTKSFFIPHDSAQIIESGFVREGLAKYLAPVEFTINSNYLTKNHLIVLDMLAQNQWKRPVYYAITVSSEKLFGLRQLLPGARPNLLGFAGKRRKHRCPGSRHDRHRNNVQQRYEQVCLGRH